MVCRPMAEIDKHFNFKQTRPIQARVISAIHFFRVVKNIIYILSVLKQIVSPSQDKRNLRQRNQ